MQKISLFIVVVLFSISCSDDEASLPTSDFLTYDNNFYSISDGLYVDFGTERSNYLSHFNYDLFLTDGEAFTNQSGRAFSNSSFIFYVELFSAGADEFDGGSFNYIDSESVTSENIDSQNWFSLVLLSTEGSYEPLAEGIESGAIEVEQDGNSFALEIDLNLKDGTTLKAKYDGALRKSIYLEKTD